jgi:hypothetical protein
LVDSHPQNDGLEWNEEHCEGDANLTLLAQRAKVRLGRHCDVLPATGPALEGVGRGRGIYGVEPDHCDNGRRECKGRGGECDR